MCSDARTSMLYLLQGDAMRYIMGAHIDANVWEMLVQGPDGAIVGAGGVQRDHSTGCTGGANSVQDCRAAGVAEVDGQVQLLPCLQVRHIRGWSVAVVGWRALSIILPD